LKEAGYSQALKFGAFCGAFQAIMPVLGWLVGMIFASYILEIGHFIAFILLVLIGGNMLINAFKKRKTQAVCNDKEIMRWQNLTMLALATSIDAMAVGVSFAVISSVNIFLSALIIGAVAFMMSYLGVLLGKKLGKLFKSGAEVLGGIILIGIGVKILIEHLI
jgi:putative Mn2+ efflux pump MntP